MKNSKNTTSRFLNKSITIYKIYSYGLLLVLFTILVLKPVVKTSYFFLDFLIGFPILIAFILAPIGLFYSIKSYKLKEVNQRKNSHYFIGHFIFTLLLSFFILVTSSDLIGFFVK